MTYNIIILRCDYIISNNYYTLVTNRRYYIVARLGCRFRRPSRGCAGRRRPIPVRTESGPVSQLPALRQRAVGRVRPTGGRQRLQRPLHQQQRCRSVLRFRLPAPSVRGVPLPQQPAAGPVAVHRARLPGRPHVVQLSQLPVLLASGAGRGAQVRAQEVSVRRQPAELPQLPVLSLTARRRNNNTISRRVVQARILLSYNCAD